MNPISIVTGAIAHPVRTAGTVTQHACGVAATGVRTTLRLIDRVAGQRRGDVPPGWAAGPTAHQAREDVVVPPATAPVEAVAAQTPAPAPEEAAAPARKSPAKKAPAKKAPAKKAPAKKAPAKKAPAKKAPVRKAPSARAATIAPALAPEVLEELEELEELEADAEGPTTPSGIPAADVAHNPDTTDTDLHQPGTPPVMDPGTVKSVLSESETLRKAADTDKG